MKCIRKEADIEQLIKCKARMEEQSTELDHLSDILSLLGNGIRLRIIKLLTEEERLCVCDLSDILDMNVSAISQHLRKLKDRSLIMTQREGQTIFYFISPDYSSIINQIVSLSSSMEPVA